MDLSNKNGQPSMEEILASIRRIIAEEPTAANPVIDLHAKYRNKPEDEDESNDFELPSIFRPVTPAPERQPLFGRLTDAIRNASGGADAKVQKSDEAQERYRGALRDASATLAVSNGQNGREAATPAAGGEERYRGALRDSGANNNLSSALSSLKLTRGSEPAPEAAVEAEFSTPAAPAAQEASYLALQVAPSPQVAPLLAPTPVAPPAPSVAPASSGVEDVRRVMVPFRDVRMSRMSGQPAAATSGNMSVSPSLETLLQTPPGDVAPPAPQTQSFSDAFAASMPSFPAPPQSFDDTLSLDDMHRFASVVQQPSTPPPPPPVAAPHVELASTGGIEDTTADLLRPMLRQWLAENMPRMVEKALSIELAQSVKSTRKFED